MAFYAIMKRPRRATLLQHDEVRDEEGWRVIVKVWRVPVSRASPDGVDYSLTLISPEGKRVVGYDNHWPKGHHRHFLGEEGAYPYTDIDTLVTDFKTDVARVRKTQS